MMLEYLTDILRKEWIERRIVGKMVWFSIGVAIGWMARSA